MAWNWRQDKMMVKPRPWTYHVEYWNKMQCMSSVCRAAYRNLFPPHFQTISDTFGSSVMDLPHDRSR